MKFGNVDFDQIKDQLAKPIVDQLNGILEGGAADLQGYVVEILADTARVATISDPARRETMQNELKGQWPMLAEKHRIRINNASWDTANRVFLVGTQVLTTLLRSAIVPV